MKKFELEIRTQGGALIRRKQNTAKDYINELFEKYGEKLEKAHEWETATEKISSYYIGATKNNLLVIEKTERTLEEVAEWKREEQNEREWQDYLNNYEEE